MARKTNWVAIGVVSTIVLGVGTIVTTVFGSEIKALVVSEKATPEMARQVVEAFKEAQLEAGKSPLEKKQSPDCCAPDSPLRANFDRNRVELLTRKVRYAPAARFISAEILHFSLQNDGKAVAEIKTTTKRPLLSESGKPLPGDDLCTEAARWSFEMQGRRMLIKDIKPI
jgi:hypothetical protein